LQGGDLPPVGVEKKYREAERVITRAVQTLEQSGESALLADAPTVRGVALARLAEHDSSVSTLRRAVDVAEGVGALTNAGLAARSLIEEHGAARLSAPEVFRVYMRADRLLKDTQDMEDMARLRACARVALRRLSGARLRDRNFSFYGAVQDFEATIIEQALEEEAGSVTRAARLLGPKHQTLTSMLQTRHQKLLGKRTPREKRFKSIIKEPEE
jgi:transcriptional regulator with GAF, ATPase, and Fis domain